MTKVVVLVMIFFAVFVAQSNAEFMVPLEATMNSWGAPKKITNEQHRYVFENKAGDTAIVYTGTNGDVLIDAVVFGRRTLDKNDIKKSLEPRVKQYTWREARAGDSINDYTIDDYGDNLLFVSSHNKYVAVAYSSEATKYNALYVFDAKLYGFTVNQGYNPFYANKSDVVNKYIKEMSDSNKEVYSNGVSADSTITTTVEANTISDNQRQERNVYDDLAVTPVVEMDYNIFPSYIIATSRVSGADDNKTTGNYRGDVNGQIGVVLDNVHSVHRIRVEVESTEYVRRSTWEGLLTEQSTSYEIFPNIEYDYSMFYQTKQPTIDTITFKIFSDDNKVYEEKKKVTIRPINECPIYIKTRNGKEHNTSFLFAAYVNEDHPAIDQFLSEAKTLGLEKSFVGYQQGKQTVIDQVFTIWYGLQRKEITYSSITETSLGSQNVFTQNIRFIDEAMNNSQANCVDGSVLIASILRRIGIDSFLVLVPGHCYVGFYASQGKKDPLFLETTMIGDVDLRKSNAWLNLKRRRDVSAENFNKALAAGNARFIRETPNFKMNKNGYSIIDISDARDKGIVVLKSSEAYRRL